MIEKFTVEIEVGDRVEVGRMHLANQTIKAIEVDKWGHPVMVLGEWQEERPVQHADQETDTRRHQESAGAI